MTNAHNIPGPPELLPGLPDAVIDLQTDAGVQLVKGQWRYSDTRVEEIDFVEVGPDLGPSGAPNSTYDVLPHAETLTLTTPAGTCCHLQILNAASAPGMCVSTGIALR